MPLIELIELLLWLAVYVAGVFLGRLWQWCIDEKKKEEANDGR